MEQPVRIELITQYYLYTRLAYYPLLQVVARPFMFYDILSSWRNVSVISDIIGDDMSIFFTFLRSDKTLPGNMDF